MVPSIYREYNDSCGNWAGYDNRNKLSYCGWMDMHNDLHGQGATKARPMFTIDVKYATDKGRLVHVVKGKLVHTRLRKGMRIKFDASKNHAFLPIDVSNEVIKKQRWIKGSKFQIEGGTNDYQVRLVWEFLP